MSGAPLLASASSGIDSAIFKVAGVLEVPVLILALAALAVALIEAGAYLAEAWSHRTRRDLDAVATEARAALDAGDRDRARVVLGRAAPSAAMETASAVVAAHALRPGGEHRINKALADFDFGAQRRLARTRLLVRAGPALGLMGTLIPLSPALTGLAQGNVARLSTDLRVAFSVTVLGLLVGAIAFGVTLYRDRMYGQDLSDLEFLAAVVDARPDSTTGER